MANSSQIYYGPSLGAPVFLTQWHQFSEIPARAQPVIKRYPGFASFFIPTSQLSATMKALQNPSSAAFQTFSHFSNLLLKPAASKGITLKS
jgi:hypothetical protein